jgi:16S rRNA (uracil1498-N3)-methyltransferase
MMAPVQTYEPKIRLFVDADLAAGTAVALSAPQAHYLRNVMRLTAGDEVLAFNGRDGEWRATLDAAGKTTRLVAEAQTQKQDAPADLWLAFAPVKRARVDYMVEKATELGVGRLLPVMTRRTNVERVNTTRLRATAIEAAEQTGRLTIPEIAEPVDFDDCLGNWDAHRKLIVGDETGGGRPILDAAAEAAKDGAGARRCAMLVGPEGGFAAEELQTLRSLPFVVTVSLGPRILRSDTAALSALAIWQAAAGDWRSSGRAGGK